MITIIMIPKGGIVDNPQHHSSSLTLGCCVLPIPDCQPWPSLYFPFLSISCLLSLSWELGNQAGKERVLLEHGEEGIAQLAEREFCLATSL